MISSIENIILKGLAHNETYTRKVLPYVKGEYFETTGGRTSFGILSEHFSRYNGCPSQSEYAVAIEHLSGLSSDEFDEVISITSIYSEEETPQNLEFLIDETEKWCKERAVYLALLDSISIHDGKDERDSGSIPAILSEALAVSFDPHVGHDYLKDYDDRYDFYHTKEERIPFGLEYFDKITQGGIPNKTLNSRSC